MDQLGNFVRRTLVIVVALAAMVYAGDYAVVRLRALFPHLGYQPSWYVRRQSQKPIPMVILVSARP